MCNVRARMQIDKATRAKGNRNKIKVERMTRKDTNLEMDNLLHKQINLLLISNN